MILPPQVARDRYEVLEKKEIRYCNFQLSKPVISNIQKEAVKLIINSLEKVKR